MADKKEDMMRDRSEEESDRAKRNCARGESCGHGEGYGHGEHYDHGERYSHGERYGADRSDR